jgi:pimeloyl-[acyl-carrier protein] methyl ester esterase
MDLETTNEDQVTPPAHPDVNLVLFPGLHGTSGLFRPLLRVLPPSIVPHVIPYPAREPLGYDELVESVLPRLPTDRPLVILGESFGGPLAIRVAAAQPPRLVGLVLCGTFVKNPHPWIPRWAAWFVQPWQFHLWPLVWWGRRVLGLGVSDEVRKEMANAIAEAGGEALACRLRAVLRVDARSDLPKVRVPILSLQATRDWIVPGRNGREIERLALSTLDAEQRPTTIVPFDTGHLILQSRSTQAAQAIEAFLCGLALAEARSEPPRAGADLLP